MKSNYIFISAILCLSISAAIAQENSRGAEQPDTGNIVPAKLLFDNVYNYNSPTLRIGDLKGKLVLLDFWATWCGSCIQHFPFLQQLQETFAGRVQIILINSKKTGDSEEKIKALIEKKKSTMAGEFTLPTVMMDSIADRLFPHHLLPHYVWISPEGKILAVTGSEEVTATNIEKVLNDNQQNLAQKKDMDIGRPLFISNIDNDRNIYYSVYVKGLIAGLPTTGGIYTEGNLFGKAFANYTVLDLYRAAVNDIYPSLEVSAKKIIIEGVDSAQLVPPASADDTSKLLWSKNNLQTYQLLIPETASDSFSRWMLQDLNRVTGFYGKVEKRKIKCLALQYRRASKKLNTSGSSPRSDLYNDSAPMLVNSPVSHLVGWLNDLPFLQNLVIDETGTSQNIDIAFSKKPTNLRTLQQELLRYGLVLRNAHRKINMLVISKNR